jgi:Rha family phage regulatory protein
MPQNNLVQIKRNHNYIAKYSVEFFQRKTIDSYALWAIYVKDRNRYPKIPNAYGKTKTLEQANIDLSDWCVAHDITLEMMRNDISPWRLVKDLLEGKSGSEYFARSITKRVTKNQIIEIACPKNDLVHVSGDKVFTDSRKIAEKFNKRHKNVLQAIENLPNDEFNGLNYQPVEYLDKKGESRKYYEITWKGFSMLAMGFTGQAAYEWKQSFLDAFESMGDYIFRHKQEYGSEQRIALRKDSKVVYLQKTDVIKQFVNYATEQGSKSANMYYQNLAKMENKALFLIEQKYPNVREVLHIRQLMAVSAADQIVEKALSDGMDKKLPYKDIYELAKDRVIQFAGIIGKSQVIEMLENQHIQLETT